MQSKEVDQIKVEKAVERCIKEITERDQIDGLHEKKLLNFYKYHNLLTVWNA